MNIISKVNKTRYTLKEVLENEWSVDSLPDLSDQEIEKMYSLPASVDKNIAPFGVASGCNFTLSHKHIPSYKLHIIYYNFPEIGKNSSKVTKSSCDKISEFYQSGAIDKDDSLFVIINENISESLEKSYTSLNINLQSIYQEGEDEAQTLSDEIIEEMKKSNHFLENKHFRNVHLFSIDDLTNNLLKHRLVPHHNVIRKKKEIDKILEMCNSHIHQLPIILKNDKVSKLLRVCNGDICEIKRNSKKSGEYSFYRVCK